MPRAVAWIVLLACGTAVADEGPTGISARARRWERDQGPLLHLEDGPTVASRGIDAMEATEGTTITLGPRARLNVASRWWKSTMSPDLFGAEHAELSRGWRTGLELSYDLGPFTFAVSAGAGRVDGRYQTGTYQHVGVSLFRKFRLSRWMLAWIALSLGERTWLGEKVPDGEERRDKTIGLTFGTTFR